MSNTENWKSWEGRTVDGKLPLRQWLGGSDHSAVFLTELQDQKSRKAAIKLIPTERLDVDRQLSLWRGAARLSHPHLIRLLEMGRGQFDNDSFLYVVMELAEEDLSQILPQRGLTPEETAAMLPPVMLALSHLHEKNFVHGHLKPSNVLAADNQLKLSADSLSPRGEVVAKPKKSSVYDAPELGSGSITSAADIWSLGVMLVAALMQHPPADSRADQKNMAVPETIPEPYRGIARACLRKDPQQRASIADIRSRLQAGPASEAVREAPQPRAVMKAESPKKSRLPIAIVAAAVALVAVVAVPKLFKHQEDPPAATSAPAKTPEPQPETATTAPVTPPPVEAAPAQATPAPRPKPATNKGSVEHQVLPDVSRSARATITGTIKITVRVDVDASGKVTNAKLMTAGKSQYFSNLALKAARQWAFTPQQVNGQPGPSVWNLAFHFKRGGTQAFPSQASSR